jgi:hypothetical protein
MDEQEDPAGGARMKDLIAEVDAIYLDSQPLRSGRLWPARRPVFKICRGAVNVLTVGPEREQSREVTRLHQRHEGHRLHTNAHAVSPAASRSWSPSFGHDTPAHSERRCVVLSQQEGRTYAQRLVHGSALAMRGRTTRNILGANAT